MSVTINKDRHGLHSASAGCGQIKVFLAAIEKTLAIGSHRNLRCRRKGAGRFLWRRSEVLIRFACRL